MATSTAPSRRELQFLATEFRHLHSEHERAGVGGGTRRHMSERLLELSARVDRLLAEWVPDEAVREAWRAHLHHGAPVPDEPGESRPALLFKGSSDAGSVAEVRERPDGDADVHVDGALVQRIDAGDDLAGPAPCTLRLDGLVFAELFDAPEDALAAAADFFGGGEPGSPPWEHAAELFADGIVDPTFALTPRGRRALVSAKERP